jgi:hypothetical protein
MPRGHTTVVTPQQDELIRKCWEHNAYGHHAAKRAAQLTGLTPEVVQRRATQLGLVFTRERYRWTEPELRVVEDHAHLALDTIQKKLRRVSPPGVKRTRAAIARQIFAQRFRSNMDGLKHAPLARALGIGIDRLHRFRDAKLIDGQRMESIAGACGYAETVADEHRHWFYHNDDIVRLLFAGRGELDLRKVNQPWLMGLLEPYITLFQPTAKDLLMAERERTRMAKRRQRKQSISTHPGQLSDETIQAIRAGKSILTKPVGRPRRKLSSGAPVSPPSSIDIGAALTPSRGVRSNSKTGSGTGTSPSNTPFSGHAGAPNAV